jgi:hypothetical protein
MNHTQLFNQMNDSKLDPQTRSGAAAKLWELQNRIGKDLKRFKSDMSDLSEREGGDLILTSPDQMYVTTVEKQPPTPNLTTLDTELVREKLGDGFFDQYIAQSYTIRWSEFRHAPHSVREKFYNLPGVVLSQTYQVKFKRKE